MARVSPASPRYNELTGFALCAFAWALFLSSDAMRADVWTYLTTFDWDSVLDELTWKIFVWVVALSMVPCSLAMIVLPFTARSKMLGDREVNSVVIIICNLVAGITATVVDYRQAIGWGLLIPLVNGALILHQLTVLGEQDVIDETDPAEASRWHATVALALTAVAFYVIEFQVLPGHWSHALVMGCVVATVIGTVLPAIAPLKPHGWRARRR